MKCTACGHQFEGNFCPECGQRVRKGRYDFKNVSEDLKDTIEVHSGFFKTSFLMFSNPGREIRWHLDGKKELYNPFKLLLVLGTVATILTFRLDLFHNEIDLFAPVPRMTEYGDFSTRYFSLTNLIGIPVFAVVVYYFYRKNELNLFESLILNVYIAAGQYIILMIFAPIIYYSANSDLSVSIYALINMAYGSWVVFYCFETIPRTENLAKAIGFNILAYPGVFFLNYFVFLIIPQPLLDLMEAF